MDNNIFSEIYNRSTVERIKSKATEKNGLDLLYNILTSERVSRIKQREFFVKCLNFIKVKGGLCNDKVSRLRKPRDYHSWRAVINEIEVPYFFEKAFNHEIIFVEYPSKKGEGDFIILNKNDKVIVEVKTPIDKKHSYTKTIEGVYEGLDTDLIAKAFLAGKRQVQKGNSNLIVICTQLCDWISCVPDAFIDYLFGGEEVCKNVVIKEGCKGKNIYKTVGKSFSRFEQTGEFLKHHGKQNTRISAIASFDEHGYPGFNRFAFSLFLNMDAKHPIDENLFPNTEKFTFKNGKCSIYHENESIRNINIE